MSEKLARLGFEVVMLYLKYKYEKEEEKRQEMDSDDCSEFLLFSCYYEKRKRLTDDFENAVDKDAWLKENL